MPDSSPDRSASSSSSPNPAIPFPSTPETSGENPPTDRILKELDGVRFRMASRRAPGYAVDAVDTFIDEIGVKMNGGEDILPTIRAVRFPMSHRRDGGYEIRDVDDFLDLLEGQANGSLPMAGPPGAETSTGSINWGALLGSILLVVVIAAVLLFAFGFL